MPERCFAAGHGLWVSFASLEKPRSAAVRQRRQPTGCSGGPANCACSAGESQTPSCALSAFAQAKTCCGIEVFVGRGRVR